AESYSGRTRWFASSANDRRGSVANLARTGAPTARASRVLIQPDPVGRHQREVPATLGASAGSAASAQDREARRPTATFGPPCAVSPVGCCWGERSRDCVCEERRVASCLPGRWGWAAGHLAAHADVSAD